MTDLLRAVLRRGIGPTEGIVLLAVLDGGGSNLSALSRSTGVARQSLVRAKAALLEGGLLVALPDGSAAIRPDLIDAPGAGEAQVCQGEAQARRGADDELAAALAPGLGPVAKAEALESLRRSRGWSGAELARRLGIGQGSLSKSLALLELPGPVRDLIDAGRLSPPIAYELRRLGDPAAIVALARRAADEELGRDAVVALVRGGAGTPRRRVVAR